MQHFLNLSKTATRNLSHSIINSLFFSQNRLIKQNFIYKKDYIFAQKLK